MAATKARVPIAASAIYRHRSDRYNNLRLSLRDIVRFNRFYARLESQKDRTVQLSSLNIWGEHYHRALPSLLAEEREENITPEECPGEGMDGEEKLLFSPPAYLRYCFTRRAFTILPLEARDVRVLLSVHRYFNLHGISTATLPGAQAGIEPSGPRKRSFAQVDGSSSMDKDTMKVCLGVGLHVYIPHSLSMQDVVALIANKLDVHYAHLMLYFSQAEGLSVLDHLTTGGSPAHAFIDCSLNEYLQSQRLQRQSTLAIYYAVLPHPLHRLISPLPSRSRPPALYTAETPAELYSTPFDDLPRCRQSLSLIISDARLRQWRRFFLADLDLQIARQNRSLSESEYAVRNEEVIELVDDEGDEDANVASAKNEPNKRLRGASSPVSSGGQPALAEEAVQSSDLYEDLMLSDGAMTRLYFPGKRMYLDNPYLPQDLGTLSVEVETAAPIFEVCTAVRAALGIPVNLTALMKEGDTEVASVYHHLYAGAAEKESEELSAARRAAHIPTATCCPAISEEVRGEAMLHPLILLLIHDGIAEEVLDALTSIADYGVAGVGVGALSSALGRRIAVQTVAPADLPALLPDVNAHPTMDDDTEDGHMPLVRPVAVERIAVSCFFFTLYGNSVEVCPESAFSGPFVSHVTAQDQHASLLERLARITGDRALAQGRYRVAVVSRKREVMAWLRPDESVFETIARCHRSSVGVRGDRGRRFAWLGIQRSVSDVQAALQGTIHAFR